MCSSSVLSGSTHRINKNAKQAQRYYKPQINFNLLKLKIHHKVCFLVPTNSSKTK